MSLVVYLSLPHPMARFPLDAPTAVHLLQAATTHVAHTLEIALTASIARHASSTMTCYGAYPLDVARVLVKPTPLSPINLSASRKRSRIPPPRCSILHRHPPIQAQTI